MSFGIYAILHEARIIRPSSDRKTGHFLLATLIVDFALFVTFITCGSLAAQKKLLVESTGATVGFFVGAGAIILIDIGAIKGISWHRARKRRAERDSAEGAMRLPSGWHLSDDKKWEYQHEKGHRSIRQPTGLRDHERNDLPQGWSEANDLTGFYYVDPEGNRQDKLPELPLGLGWHMNKNRDYQHDKGHISKRRPTEGKDHNGNGLPSDWSEACDHNGFYYVDPQGNRYTGFQSIPIEK